MKINKTHIYCDWCGKELLGDSIDRINLDKDEVSLIISLPESTANGKSLDLKPKDTVSGATDFCNQQCLVALIHAGVPHVYRQE